MKLPTTSLLHLLVIFLWSFTTELQVQATVGLYGPDRYEGLPEICLMPMDFGYCRAKVQRYYFDIRRMKCTMFYWGGCAGNDNNFKNLEECNNFCTSAYEDHIQNEISVKNEPIARDTAARGSSVKFNSRDSSSITKSVPKFALKANVSSKETGYKSQFKASSKSFNVAPKPTINISNSNSSKSDPLDSMEDEDYDD